MSEKWMWSSGISWSLWKSWGSGKEVRKKVFVELVDKRSKIGVQSQRDDTIDPSLQRVIPEVAHGPHWGRRVTYPVGTLWVCCEFWSNSPSHYLAGMWWVLLKSTHQNTQWVLFEWNPWVCFKKTHQITQRVLFERMLQFLPKSTHQFDQDVPSRFFSKYP